MSDETNTNPTPPAPKSEYLGDGVYAYDYDDGYHIKLTADDENIIFLDESVLLNFILFVVRARPKLNAEFRARVDSIGGAPCNE